MKLQFFCPRWGSEDIAWDDFIKKVKDAGYSGVEFGVPLASSINDMEAIWAKIERQNLAIIPQHFDTHYKDFNRHYDAYAKWLHMLEPFNAVKLNLQTGKDYFSFEQNKALIILAQQFSDKTGITVCHEIHRGRFTFAAHITQNYLQQIPDLKLTFDVSHWLNVAESYLQDQPEAVALAIERSDHLHARIGYPEGPQVTDPRSPEWEVAVAIHLAWWQKIAALNPKGLTITPEFGPAPYMLNYPFTDKPIANQWEINSYMMELIRNKISID